ncbi:unnamed protein product [Schistosoma curassoni]|uniref:DHC_N1 domain-containing protein n=1 Tax=Schistosoma curassoni TaxID=6186 RepID=A0A183L5P8_9TREM|nr:unnamed protein product [Schistosoma curassoni]
MVLKVQGIEVSVMTFFQMTKYSLKTFSNIMERLMDYPSKFQSDLGNMCKMYFL